MEPAELVEVIRYKLKSGCQWRMLPVKQFFTGASLTQSADSSHWATVHSFSGCGLPDVIGPAHLMLARAAGF